MITNDVQYRTAKGQVDRLAELVADLRHRPLTDAADAELRRKLEMNAVEGQMGELRGQLQEYEDLRAGREPVGRLVTIDDLPRLLVRARIAAGLSQRDLAQKLNLKEQQIQRYEATGYNSASLARLREVAHALGLDDGVLPSEAPTSKDIFDRLAEVGLDQAFVRRRLAPAVLRERSKKTSELAPVIDLAARVGRVFGWEAGALLTGEHVEPDRRVLAAASFKLPQTTDEGKVAAYTVYAHYIAMLTLQVTNSLPQRPLPSNAAAFRAAWDKSGSVGSFEDLVRLVWDLGIPIVPLADPGGFHAAVWKAQGRNVIVLKQGARRLSRWTFDLLHEIGHVLIHLTERDGGVIDGDEASTDSTEEAANVFAGNVLLDGRAEEIIELCVKAAQGSVERLKGVVPKVAAAQGVDVGALSNYLAFRLSGQNINWWGTASNLQPASDDPWDICRDVLLERADLAALNPLDRELMNQALVA